MLLPQGTRSEQAPDATDSKTWNVLRPNGYNNLHWAKNPTLLQPFLEISQPRATDLVYDIGSGNGIIAETYAPHVKSVIAVDFSYPMLEKARVNLDEIGNVRLVQGSGTAIPLQSHSADTVVQRMMLHHLPDITPAVQEMVRCVKPGGHAIFCEFVSPDVQCYEVEKSIFQIKEPGRQFWTPQMLEQEIQAALPDGKYEVSIVTTVLPQNSVNNWLDSSGLHSQVKQQIFQAYKVAPQNVVRALNITEVHDSHDRVDLLVDRTFAFVVVTPRTSLR